MPQNYNALTLSHKMMAEFVREGGLCIDATMGRGYDTAYLCGLTGSNGKVLAFDIQQDAVDSTSALLKERGLSNARLILDSHSNMEQYAEPESVDCVTFNFGWLPKGDHSIFTSAETSIPAIEAAMRLIRPQGLISMCIYYGKDSGFSERDALLSYFPTIDFRQYTVVVNQFVNRPNCPTIFAYIIKGM